jgi:hypothetical protein
LDAIGAKVRELRMMAGDRGASLDVALAYPDRSISSPSVDVERHRELLGSLAEIGVTWVVVVGATADRSASLDFLAEFGASYINP